MAALVLKCPHCGNTQKFLPIKAPTPRTRRTCVYCGKGFAVVKTIVGESEP